MPSERCMGRNAELIALFFMQYSFLIPIMCFISSTLVVGVFSGIALIILLFSNQLGFLNWKLVGFYFAFIMLFVFKVVLRQADISTIGYIVLFTFPVISMFLFPFDYSVCIRSLITISRLSFFAIVWIPFFTDFNYMRFGYGMLPILIMMYVDLVYKRNKEKNNKDRGRLIDIGIFGIGFLEMLLYGARGCLVALIIFIGLDRLLINKKHIIRNLILILLTLIIVINIVPILDAAERLSERIGIYSYSITKFKMQLEGGFEYAASGRVPLYEQALEKIRMNPIFGGYIEMSESGGEYAHNLFLQVGEDFGIPAIIILSIFLLYTLFTIGRSKGPFDGRVLIMLLFSTSVGRLLLSSTIWRRPEFWMLVGAVLTIKRNNKFNDDTLSDILGGWIRL